jgi:hypothetical protein
MPLPSRRLELLISEPDLTEIAEELVANIQWSFFGLEGMRLHDIGHDAEYTFGNVCAFSSTCCEYLPSIGAYSLRSMYIILVAHR